MKHTCVYHETYDPVTYEPTGPACGADAVLEIRWRDGRVSPACEKHGIQSLEVSALTSVKRVVRPKTERGWKSKG